MSRSWILRIYAVMAKEFTQLRRDRVTYAMILVMPIIQLILFGYAINTDPRGLPAAVIASASWQPARERGRPSPAAVGQRTNRDPRVLRRITFVL